METADDQGTVCEYSVNGAIKLKKGAVYRLRHRSHIGGYFEILIVIEAGSLVLKAPIQTAASFLYRSDAIAYRICDLRGVRVKEQTLSLFLASKSKSLGTLKLSGEIMAAAMHAGRSFRPVDSGIRCP